MMTDKYKTVFGLILAALLLCAFLFFLNLMQSSTPAAPSGSSGRVLSFEDCAAAGYPIMESYPRQCRASDGRLFVEELPAPDRSSDRITYINASSSLIVVDLPFPGAVVGKEFSVIGQARGFWFFEASFPIEVIDKDGNRLAIGIAQAQGDGNWMTENFVPFRADIKIPESYIGPATLILRKDNPSDMREYDASISFPITIEY